MAFDQQELNQLGDLIDTRVGSLLDVKVGVILDAKLGPILDAKLAPIRHDLQTVKQDLDGVRQMLSEDISAAYTDIKLLKKKDLQLVKRIAVLER